jgi:dihydroneopterin aldolase
MGTAEVQQARGIMQQHPDIVFIERLQVYAFHGVHPEERALGQRFDIDLQVETSTRQAGLSDRLDQTVSYSDLARKVKAIVEGEPKQLIEAVAESVAAAVLAEDERIGAVTVTIRKPNAPIKGVFFAAAGVTIRRERGEIPE